WVPRDAIPTEGRLTESMAIPMSPLLDLRTTLKDALSMMLDADVQAGIVVDGRGRVEGIVTVDLIADWMREGAAAAGDSVGAAPAAAEVTPR
ncbi:MAG: CBS domain-containing protein, partial [Chloroflexota bacterium]|nr:CBS domain-containing protein [Chloroflexota bacterium]